MTDPWSNPVRVRESLSASFAQRQSRDLFALFTSSAPSTLWNYYKRVAAPVRPVQSPQCRPDFACCPPLRRRVPSAESEPDSFVLSVQQPPTQ